MFVVTPAGVIATDPVAYGRPTGGQTYLDEIRKVTGKPVKYLIPRHPGPNDRLGTKQDVQDQLTFLAACGVAVPEFSHAQTKRHPRVAFLRRRRFLA